MAAQAGPVYDIAYSPDGSRVATVSPDGTARLWDPASGLPALSLFSDTPAAGFSGVAFSPDGQRVAAGGIDGTVLVGDATTGHTLQTLRGHTDIVWGLAFSRDGKRLTTASFDKLAKVWDVDSGQEVATLYGNAGTVFGVTLSPDGRRLATAGADGTMRFYTLPVDELVALARSRTTRSLTTEECRRFLHLQQCPAGSGEAVAAAGAP